MASSAITITVKGIPELLRKLQVDTSIQPNVRRVMQDIGELGSSTLRDRAPRRTGNLAAHLTHKLSAKPIPTYVSWQATATRSSARYSNYPYPKRLEYDAKLRHAGWMHETIAGLMSSISSLMGEAAERIAGDWAK